ncbi:MAG: hypothetical protein WD294_00120 [Phycisphaeraceae bacterium]
MRFPVGVTVVLLALSVLSIGGCGDSPDAAVEDMVTTLEEMGEALAAIENRADAEAAVDDLLALAERWQEADARMGAMGELTPDDNHELLERYRDRMASAGSTMIKQMMRLEEVDALEPLEPVFEKMGMSAPEA